MTTFLQYTFNGISTGAVYALVAVATTLSIGIARFFNFAQGQLIIFGAMIAAVLTGAGVPFFLSIPIAIIACVVLGGITREAFHYFGKDDSMVVFLGTLGVGLIITYSMVLIWGPEQRSIETPFDGDVHIGGLVLPEAKFMLLAIATPLVIALYLLLGKTGIGLRMRACAESPEVASLLGVNVQRTLRGAVALSSILGAVAGVLIGTLYPFSAFAGNTLLIKGFAVALVGGLGSVSGAVICGLLLGLVETYASGYGVPLGFTTLGSGWTDMYAFVLMIVVLAWRPRGFFRTTGEPSL